MVIGQELVKAGTVIKRSEIPERFWRKDFVAPLDQ
jgi:hypothetical protein